MVSSSTKTSTSKISKRLGMEHIKVADMPIETSTKHDMDKYGKNVNITIY
jgi:hypothetical protein